MMTARSLKDGKIVTDYFTINYLLWEVQEISEIGECWVVEEDGQPMFYYIKGGEFEWK